MRATRLIVVLFVLAFSFAAGGCSISDSIGSISDSISSPSTSLSASSGSGDSDEKDKAQDEKSYLKDVTQLGVTYAKNGGDVGALRSAVSQLAVARGMTNWEVDDATRKALGAGLAKGEMSESDFDAFAKSLFGDDLAKASSLRSGYAGEIDDDEDSD